MDGGVVTPSEEKHISFGEVFRQQCPVYMSLGMSLEEYWDGSPRLCAFYRKKHELDQDRANFELWLGGYYHFIGISTALANAFKDKGKKADEYPREPIRLRPLSKEELEQERQKKQEEILKKLNAWQQGWVDRHKGDNDAE